MSKTLFKVLSFIYENDVEEVFFLVVVEPLWYHFLLQSYVVRDFVQQLILQGMGKWSGEFGYNEDNILYGGNNVQSSGGICAMISEGTAELCLI